MAQQLKRPTAPDPQSYVTVSRLEINQILHTLARQGALVTASLGGDNFFLTSILYVDESADLLLIESGKRNPHKARIPGGQRIMCTTSLDKIKIRFQLDSPALATHDGEEALSAPLPRELMRLQRRQHYRMRTPVLKPVTCTLAPLPKEQFPTTQFTLLDISCGGIAVITPAEVFTPQSGAHYECTLRLPGGELKTQVQARYTSTMKLANNKTAQRCVFEFMKLQGHALAMIQRYLMQLELERSTRGGMR